MSWDIPEQTSAHLLQVSDVMPSQLPSGVLFTLNAPVTPLFVPVIIVRPAPFFQYIIFLPIIVAWWWWLGMRLEVGILGKRPSLYPAWGKFLAGLLALTLSFFAIQDFRNACEYVSAWFRYSTSGHIWEPLKPLAVGGWCTLLAFGAARATVRLYRVEHEPSQMEIDYKALGGKFSSVGFWVVCLFVLSLGAGRLRGRAAEWAQMPPPPRIFTTVSGSISDDDGKLLDGLLLELLPEDMPKRSQSLILATAKQGRYVFKVESGVYRLALNCRECDNAPTADQPFQTSFYPGVETKAQATRITVKDGVSVQLQPLRVHRLPVVGIPAQVNWSNGAAAGGSNFVVINLDYPGAIVEAKQSDEHGRGNILLPVGFKYSARAAITCDEGKTLSTHESRPLFNFRVKPGLTPKPLKFVIPDVPCKLWEPK